MRGTIWKVFLWTATTEFKSGRAPQGLTHRLGYWKAEDLQKFAFPASECVPGGLLPGEEYHIWILAVRLTELVFGASRYGWTMEMLELACHLILRHYILTEEVQGLQSWYVTFHNLIHLLEDVERFSSPDNYCCFSFERAMNMLRDHLTRILNTPLQGLRVKGSSSSSSENRTSQERWLMTYLQKC